MQIGDAIKEFLGYCVFEKGLSDKTIASYTNDLNVYKEFLAEKGVRLVANIESQHIKDFLKHSKILPLLII